MAMSGGNATATVTLNANMDPSGILNAVKTIQGSFNSLKLNPNLTNNITKEFSNLQKLLEDYRKAMDKPVTSKKDLKNLENLEKAINSSFSTLTNLYSEINNQTIITKVDSSKLDELKTKTKEAQKALQDVFSNIKVGTSNNGLQNIENSIEKAVARSKTLKNSFNEVFSELYKSGDINRFASNIDSIFNNLSNKLKSGKLQPTIDSLLNSFKSLGLIKIDMPLDSTAQKLLALKSGFDTLKTAIANGLSGDELKVLIENLNEATKAEQKFHAEALKKGQDNYKEQANSLNMIADGAKRAAEEQRKFKQQTLDATTQLEQLQSSTQYFFGLRNMLNLLKRGVHEAIDTIKQLDAAMTETAVVTNFSVGDMWSKLPEYTANANALGATVQDMYKSTTLYYQQGLNAEQAMGIASETMKMARIAGLEAADATDMMTAALRGFNMELSETSAQRINDVYSNLAAKTASNTEELGNAMQRTASIAANAGMSFEGTAAFLAQAIETTREPAENIGTAMKTIIARMQEMKKNPLEIGEVEGEEVDYNKIDAALKSVGISLKKANGDFRDNDEVLLDISKHWDSLSQTQQRYIATTVAGSRQQSRFIAMVGNYERTQELLKYANDSEGASNEQFGKTLDSLEAKLNKFQNAWKDFLMSIMNDSWTKTIVSGATSVLNIVNKIIDTLSFGSKGIKSALALFTAFNALKATGIGANMLIGGIGGMMSPGSSFKEGFMGGASGLASKGTNKIVKAIYDLVPHIDKAAANDQYKYTGFGDYKKAQKELAKQILPNKQKVGGKTYTQSGNEYSIAGVNAVFDKNKLNKEQQKALLSSMPGLKKNMTKNLAKIMQDAGADSKVSKGLIAGFKKGEITSEQVLQKSGLLTNYTDALENRATEGGEKAAKAFAQAQRQTLSREERQNILNQGKAEGNKGRALQQYYREKTNEKLQAKGNIYTKNAQVDEALKATRELSKSEAAANTLNAIGSAATSAGMSLQMLGSQIAVTNPIVGEAIAQFGGLVMTLGSIPNAMAGIIAGGPVAWGVAAAVTALGIAYGAFTIHAKRVAKAAEEVQKKFEDANTETQKNISTLKQYQQQAGQWAKGVDINGNNVSLTDDEYNQYLNAVDEIAKINPSIVEGYNAQGHAIININKALSDTIALEQQRQKDAFKEYLDPASLDKLIKARNVDSSYLQSTTTLRGKNGFIGNVARGMGKAIPFAPDDAFLNVETWIAKQANAKLGIDLFVENTAPFQDDVQNVITELQKDLDTEDLSSFLSPFGIDWEKLSQNDAKEIQKVVQRRNELYSAAMQATKGELSEKTTEVFNTLGDNSKEFSESIDNSLQWLRTYVAQSDAFDGLSEELKQGINKGLENIVMQPDLTATDMIAEADDLVRNFEKLISVNSDYTEALKTVEDAQNEFAITVNEEQYRANVEPAIQDLLRLKQEALDKGTAYGDALAEYLENQIQRIANFTKEGGANLSEALNTATDEIAAAEGALENFNNATKTDYSTAAEGMKSIFDKTTETFKDSYGTEIQKHAEGMGDATFWTGAEALLSGKELERLTEGKDGYEAAEAVSKRIQELEPMLREGQEGFDAFTDRVLENADAMDKLAEAGVTYDKESGLITNIPDDQWHNVAEALGISDELLTSMLNKGRQFADISFMNVEDARKALAASDYTIKGTQAKAGEQQNLYVKEDTLRAELANAGYVRREQQDEQIAKLLDEGVKTIPADATELTPKELDMMAKDWGVSTLPDLIQTLNETGDFTKDEIKNYADQMGLLGSDAQYDTLYSDIIEAAENPELVKQTGVLETISAQVAALADTRTGKEAKKDYDEAHKALVGGEGIDTDAQAFAMGKKLAKDEEGNILRDSNGNPILKSLSAGEYEQTKESLQATANSFRETAAIAAEKAKTAPESERAYWEQVQAGAEADAARVDKYLQMAHNAMKEQEAEMEGNAREKEARDKARKKERKAKEKEEKDNAEETAKEDQNKGKKQTDKEKNRPKTEQEGRAAQDEAKHKADQQKAQEELKKANQERWENEDKRAQEIAEAEKQKQQERLKTQKDLQEKNEIEGQKLKQRYEAEEQARKRKNIEEQAQLENEKLVERAKKQQEAERNAKTEALDQGRAQNREITTEQTIAQAEDIQSKTDFLLRKSIDTSLKTALDGLDPTQIAQDPAQAQAFSNLYADLINERLPNPEDLDTLGILGQLSSNYQEALPGIEEFNSQTTNFIDNWKSLLTKAGLLDALNFEQFNSTGGKVEKAITSVGERLKSWWDKINGVEASANTNPPKQNVAPTVSQGASAVAQIAQEAAQETQAKFTVDTSDGEAKLDNLQSKTDSVASTINQGATFVINAPGAEKLDKAAKAAQTIAKNAGNQTIGVKTGKVDTSSVDTTTSTIKRTQANIQVGANTDQAVSKINQIVNRRYSNTIDIEAHVRKTGISSITIDGKTVNVSARATGQHNHGYISGLPSIGSAARGSYGQLGPKGKGGLTLTGELGYEIAWLPSENRSMILGANGPQLVDLPGDAVVWTHEQSKRMVKQKAIPAGSHADESASSSSYKKKYNSPTVSTPVVRSSTSTSNTVRKTIQQAGNKVEKAAEESKEKIARVSVWWENIARRTEATQRKMDKNAKTFEKYLKETNVSLSKVGSKGKGNAYIKNIEDTIKLNKTQVGRAKRELKQLQSGKVRKKDSKGKKYKNPNKAAYKRGDVNVAEISYTNKKGESKKKYINLARFITKDKATGALQVSEKALKKVKNSEQRKAIADAANREIDDRTSKKNKAEDAIEKANEALEKMGEDLYNTFFAWETELTRIWNITQKIESTMKRIEQNNSYMSLLEAQMNSGQKVSPDEVLETFKRGLELQNQNIDNRKESIKANIDAVRNAFSMQDERARLDNVTKILNTDDKNKKKQENANKKKTDAENKKKKAEERLSKKGSLWGQIQGINRQLENPKLKLSDKIRKNLLDERTKLLRQWASIDEEKEKKNIESANKEIKAAKKDVKEANKLSTLDQSERLAYEAEQAETEKKIKTINQARKYATYSQRADGTMDISVDYEKIQAAKDAGKLSDVEIKAIEDYIKGIQEASNNLQDDYNSLIQETADLYNNLADLKDQWADASMELLDISKESEQKKLDEFKKLSDSISDALKKLLDQVKKTLDQRRQKEDNAKTEQDISRKQQRLAALQADTSGGHQVEIAQLQKEIAEAQQNYQRTLEDQLLEKLQEQADLAAEQRERQIELQEEILDSTNNIALINQWMQSPADFEDEMREAYFKANNYENVPQAEQERIAEKWNTLYTNILTNKEKREATEQAIRDNQDTLADIVKQQADNQELISTWLAEEKAYEFEQAGYLKNQELIAAEKAKVDAATKKAQEAAAKAEKERLKKQKEQELKAAQQNYNSNKNKKNVAWFGANTDAGKYYEKLFLRGNQYKTGDKNWGKLGADGFKDFVKKGKAIGKSEADVAKDLANTYQFTWAEVLKAAKAAKYTKSEVSKWATTKNFKDALKNWSKYATGGLADYTGPAWLDGTPSKPELVLNAQDTKNFIALKDVLNKAIGSANSVENTYGNATYEININVDHLNNDYDVDKVVERVKKKIVQDSSYRNVTQVRKFR